MRLWLCCCLATVQFMVLFWLEYCSIRSIYPSTNASVNVAMPSAVDLAKRELVKYCGMWPARMKKLDRSVHDGLVADDLRDLSFLENNQEKLQGKYNRPVELFTTPGGDLAVTLDLFRLPMVFTINNDTRNLGLLKTSDFLKKRGNVRVLSFSGRPGEAPPAASLPEPAQAEG